VQTDLTGFPELTPYRGGWCGNDVFPDVFGPETRDRIISMARRLGDRLGQEGYRGVFCFDFLLDTDDGEVYLGEINPRISGASPLTNLITAKYGGIPLFLFHLLEFMDVDWELDLDAVQERWRGFDGWSQLVLKQTTDDVELITKAPQSGLWRLTGDGEVRFIRPETDWHAVGGEDEAFYLQVYGPGDYRYPGADLGVIVARGRMQTDDRELYERAKLWSAGITSQFESIPLDQAIEPPDQTYTKWF
jgi:biotin carboxylase